MPVLDRVTPPAQLEEYRILRPLGHGAMGRVYLAHDTLLDRPVAIKFLALLDQSLSEDTRAGLRERFFVEARAIARLQHPNVVTIYRVGEWRGRPYLVSELVRGQSLDRLPRPQPGPKVLEIALGLCRGLAAAHRRSVLHRDLKPANAMLTGAGEVKLLDFGLAKLLEPTAGPVGASLADLPALRVSRELLPVPGPIQIGPVGPAGAAGDALQATRAAAGRPAADLAATHAAQHELELSATAPQLRLLKRPESQPPEVPEAPEVLETPEAPEVAPVAASPGSSGPSGAGLTQVGDVLGSPLYMAPELWRGEPPTPRADLYSLGTLLYELCAGRAPHDGVTIEELPLRAQEVDAPPLGTVAPAVDPRLCAIIDRCLRREPEARFESADALLAALEGLSERAPLGAREAAAAGNPYRGLASFEARHRALFFGRDAEARAILERLRAEPLVVVTGDSGVGKSSLCQAGVLAAVPAGVLGPGVTVVRVPPGRRRLGGLASALAAALGRDEAELLTTLRTTPQEIGRDLRQKNRRTSTPRRLLLFLDQLEDVFAQSEPESLEPFGRALRELCDYAPDIQLLACVRSDFLSRLAALPGLGPEVGRALFLLGPLQAEGLRESIVRPALLCGFRFESEALVDSLVAAASQAVGGLPLLQFTLSLLWDARDRERGIVPQAALDQLGGLGGALARYADGVLQRLLPAQRRAARELLGQLVTLEATRAQRTRSELLGAPELGAVPEARVAAREALDALVHERLITVHSAGPDPQALDGDGAPAGSDEPGAPAGPGDGGDRGSLYELAHDALLTRWDTLRGWLAHDAERRAVRQRLSRAASEWERLGRAPELLFQPLQLREVSALFSDEQERELPARDAAFLRVSRRAARWLRVRRLLLVGSAPLLLGLLWVGAQLRASHTIRQQALGHLTIARDEVAQARRQNQQAEALRTEVLAQFDGRHQTEAEKQWDRLQALESELRAGYRRASKAAEAAFMLRSSDPQVRDTLAEVLSERALVAERGGFLSSRDELLARVWLFDHDGRYRRRWLAPARLELRTTPAAAAVVITPIDDQHHLREAARRELGVTPLVGAELAPGAYLLQLRPQQPDRLPVSYPIDVERGESLRIEVRLPRAAAIPVGFAYVPAGRSIFGSNADDNQRRDFFYNVPAHPVRTGSFLIARHETTYAEWLTFLRALPPDELERRRPRAGQAGASGSLELRKLPGAATEAGDTFELQLQPMKAAYRAREGEQLQLGSAGKRPPVDWQKLPVTGISSEDALAYLRWLDTTGRVPGARLCTEVEWERAARGADERHYPHGDQLLPSDAAFDQTYGQDPEAMGPDPVGSHPASRSLFGVDDLTGNAFEWTVNSVSDKPFALRGGAYFYGGRTCRLDNRHESVPTLRDATVGLRVCATMRED